MKIKFEVIIAFASEMTNNLPNYFAVTKDFLRFGYRSTKKQAFLPTNAFANKLNVARKIKN